MIAHEKLISTLSYDPETGVFRNLVSRGYLHGGEVCGWKNGNGYLRITIEGKSYYAHRLAWFYAHKTWPDVIDHINQDRSDNRLINLRPASKSQNAVNGKRLHRGATFSKKYHRWVAQIRWQGKSKFLGHFDTESAACAAYAAAAQDRHGEFFRGEGE